MRSGSFAPDHTSHRKTLFIKLCKNQYKTGLYTK